MMDESGRAPTTNGTAMSGDRGPLQRALDETGVGVALEAQEATWRAAYGDEVVDAMIRRHSEELMRDAARRYRESLGRYERP